jgi:hypothetical protein
VNQTTPPWRFDTVDTSMDWTTSAPISQIPCAAGISPMAPENAIQLRLFLHPGYRWGWNYPLENLDSSVVDLLNVRYVITRAEDVPRFAALPKFHHIASLPGNELFENDDAYPRFFLVHQVHRVDSLEQARDVIARHEVDLRKTAIIEGPVALAAETPGETDAVTTLKYEPNAIELAVGSASGGFLVLSETYYPGWKAWVDNRAIPIYQADIGLRGVVVPGGTHQIRLEFRPAILPISLGISLVTASLLGLSAFISMRKYTAESPPKIQLN